MSAPRPSSPPRPATAAALTALLTAGLLAPRAAQAQHIETIARVIATSDVHGHFAHPVCDEGRTLEPVEDAAFTYALVREARASDRPLVVDMGGLLSPHGVARFAAQHRPAALATMVDRLGYRALGFGLNDLSAPRAGFVSVATELRERRIPIIASNLRCAESAQALCDVLVDGSDGPSIHLVNGRRTAVLSVLRPDAPTLVAPNRSEGLELDDPKETIERLTRLARERGVEIVVAIVDEAVEGGPVQLAAELDPEARPDLLLVAGGDGILFARPRTVRPVLVGAPVDDAVEVRIRDSEEMRAGYEFLAQPLEGRGASVGRPVRRFIDQVGPAYCAAWGRPLAGAPLDEELDLEGMLDLVARIVRDRAGADVAVINRHALDRRWRPAHEGSLTASDVYIAVQYDEPLMTSNVDVRWLRSLALQAENSGELSTPGLTWTMTAGAVSSVVVDGHVAEPRAEYSVVTLRFLAAGGDGALPPLLNGQWVPLGEATVRNAVLSYLEQPRENDPRETVSDPAQTVQWLFGANADLTFSGGRIDNPQRRCTEATPAAMCQGGFVVDEAGATSGAYTTTQLSQNDLLIFGLTVDLSANAAAPDWTWQNSANALYRTTWTEPAAGTRGGFIEAADQIRVRSTLSSRGLRQLADNAWFVPDPTLDLFVESEFNAPDSREFHWMLTRPTAGLRFQLVDKLQLQIVGGIQVQALDPEAEVEAGLGGTLTLTPWDFIRLDQQFGRLAFTFDYFLSDLGDENRGALRGQLDAAFDLGGPLALAIRVNLLMQHEDGQDIGVALSATAGVRLGYLGRSTGG